MPRHTVSLYSPSRTCTRIHTRPSSPPQAPSRPLLEFRQNDLASLCERALEMLLAAVPSEWTAVTPLPRIYEELRRIDFAALACVLAPSTALHCVAMC